jgi:hypothetical protein
MKQKWLPTREDEEIPPELKGSQKWSAVKFNEKKAPSKRSVFLGTSDNEEVCVFNVAVGVSAGISDGKNYRPTPACPVRWR